MIGRCCEPPCPPKICAHVRDCGGVAVSGATASVTGPDSYTASGTTDATGWWCADAGDPGDYDVTVDDGTIEETKTVAVTAACTSYTATFCLGGGYVCATVTGCGLAQTGVEVNFRRAGTIVATATTDASGEACACVPSAVGALTVTVDSPPSRYAAKNPGVAVTLKLCYVTRVTIPLDPASSGGPLDPIEDEETGYHCLPCDDCQAIDMKPAADVLTVSGLYGGGDHTMRYGAAADWYWYGSYVTTLPACDYEDAYGIHYACPEFTLKVEFGMPVIAPNPSGLCFFKIFYTLLDVDYDTDNLLYYYCGICHDFGEFGGKDCPKAIVPWGGSFSAITWSSCPPTTTGTATVTDPERPPMCTPVPNTTTITITE